MGTYLLAFASQRRVLQGRLGDGVDLGRADRDAVELANAAYEVAKSTPAAVRAVAACSLAKAQAAVGNAHGFHAAADEARALLDTPGALDALPPYLTWFGLYATMFEQLQQSAVYGADARALVTRAMADLANDWGAANWRGRCFPPVPQHDPVRGGVPATGWERL